MTQITANTAWNGRSGTQPVKERKKTRLGLQKNIQDVKPSLTEKHQLKQKDCNESPVLGVITVMNELVNQRKRQSSHIK
jgi:hypothetical protein